MQKFLVTLEAERSEYNTMTVEAENAAAAAQIAIVEDDGDYEPGDLGESWVVCIKDAKGNELPIPAPADSKPVPCPDAADLKSAMQWLLDDMHDAGETHANSRKGIIFDSVENAARALLNAGGVLSWYEPSTRLPVINCYGTEIMGYASSPDEATTLAYDRGAKSVSKIDRRPITIYPGPDTSKPLALPEAFVVIA